MDPLPPDVFFPAARFASRSAFKHAIAEELAETRRGCTFPNNNPTRITARCEDRECDYVVHGRVRTGGAVEIKTRHVMHACPPGSSPSTPSCLVNEVATTILRYDPEAKAGDVVARAIVDYSHVVTYNQAYRALTTIRKGFKTTSELSYGLVIPWLQSLQVMNPGTIIDFERAPDGNITKAFLLLSSWERSYRACIPVLSLDACHLRCKEGGTLFLASALSGNRDIIIVAGIGKIEDRQHWEWFVANLQLGINVSESADAVVMSDREKGLDAAPAHVLPTIPHGFCSVHLKKNVLVNYKTDLNGQINTLAKALTRPETEELFAKCAGLSEAATDYLKDIGHAKWLTVYFSRPRFGLTTTNMSESTNSWLLEEREHTWMSCLADIVRKTQGRMYEKRQEYDAIRARFAPWVEARVQKMYALGRKRLVSRVSDSIFEVKRESSQTIATVDLAKQHCSCLFWAEHQYPCVHACAAIIVRREDPLDFVSDVYSTARLRSAFAPYAVPVDIAFCASNGTKPPAITKRRGRPKKIRIRNRSEYINGDSPYRCSMCHGVGHNSRMCERRQKATSTKK